MPVWLIPIRDGWLAYARPMCALSVRADIDGRDSLDGYRNRSRYYQGIAHEVPIRAVAATVMSVQGPERKWPGVNGMSVLPPNSGHHQLDRACPFRADIVVKVFLG